MEGNFYVERSWFPEGESAGSVDEASHVLFMTDSHSQGTVVEWGEARSRRRSLVFPGDFWVLPQGQPWWTRAESGKNCIQFAVSGAWLGEITHSSSGLVPQVQLRDALVAQMLRTLADSAKTFPRNPTTELYQESLATSLSLHLVTHYGSRTAIPGAALPLPSVRLRAISNYIREHIEETISLGELSQLAGLSASQFSLRFRATTGQTPHQFVVAMRVERARELIASGKHSLADVAALSGFADQSHLTRHIRRSLGVTPAALKK